MEIFLEGEAEVGTGKEVDRGVLGRARRSMFVEGKNSWRGLRTGKGERQDKRMLVEGKNSWEGNYWHGGRLLIGKER
jgi:hypothetical protein